MIDLFFDFSSPWSYFGFLTILRMNQSGIRFRPVLYVIYFFVFFAHKRKRTFVLFFFGPRERDSNYVHISTRVGAVFNQVNPSVYQARKTPMPKLKYEYMNRDFRRWARTNGVEAMKNPYDPDVSNRPFPFPVSSAKALRIALGIESGDDLIQYSLSVFRAYWVDRKDISRVLVLREILKELFGMKRAKRLIAVHMNSDHTKQKLRDNVNELIRRGGFGVPTVFIDDDMYFGVDRMIFVEKKIDENCHSAIVTPRSSKL